ncbi:MAG: hypothetical protein O3A46_12360 [Candidatus Poribacteria bacterium]|nr:hypothetical protein [Candidatus Poribacteria bacterium]
MHTATRDRRTTESSDTISGSHKRSNDMTIRDSVSQARSRSTLTPEVARKASKKIRRLARANPSAAVASATRKLNPDAASLIK